MRARTLPKDDKRGSGAGQDAFTAARDEALVVDAVQ
jgi:hypothetical protein